MLELKQVFCLIIFFYSHESKGISGLIITAGLPATTEKLGTSFVTTEAAPITE